MLRNIGTRCLMAPSIAVVRWSLRDTAEPLLPPSRETGLNSEDVGVPFLLWSHILAFSP